MPAARRVSIILKALPMKFQIQTLKILIFAGLFALNSTAVTHAKPKDKERWNKKYDKEAYIFGETPIPFLVDNIHILHKGHPPMSAVLWATPPN